MGRMNRKKKAQLRILGEIRKQLILQAERWGKKDYYTPSKLEEIELDQCHKIKGELLSEKSNLEYEMHMLDSDKKEVLIKLERLNQYLKRADRVVNRHEKNIVRIIEKLIGNKKAIDRALKGIEPKSLISVLISDN